MKKIHYVALALVVLLAGIVQFSKTPLLLGEGEREARGEGAPSQLASDSPLTPTLSQRERGQTVHLNERTEELVIETTSGKRHFHVEIADTPASQELGLMHRTSMPQDHGMLFEVDKKNPQRISLWMKNTLIPLDMIFIDPTGKIVGIVENAEPQTLTPRGPDVLSAAVLELNGGTAARNEIKVGDTVVHPFFQ